MKRGLVHKLRKKRVFNPSSSALVLLEKCWVTQYVIDCQPDVTPPTTTSHSSEWKSVTCPKCRSLRPRLQEV